MIAGEKARVGELTAAALNTHQRDPQLAMLLALHAINISNAVGEPVPSETVVALHLGLQAAGVPYPVQEARAVVIDGPTGPRGIFGRPLPELIGLAEANLERSLSADECRSWLGTDRCPALPSSIPTDLAWNDPASVDGADGTLAGTTVRIVSPGFHAFRMQSEADDYAEQAGITVDVDFELDPDARLALGEVDLGALPAPGAVVGRGDEGELIDLLHWFDREALRDQLSDPMLALGSDGPDGAIWGLPFGLNLKSAIWYPIPEFHEAGYEVPTTWSELVELCDQMVADGRTPWGMAETLGGATGWPSTDWIEDLVLHDLGPEAYDDWVAHEIRFDDPRIRRAFERYAELLLGEGRIHNGPEAAITTNLEVGMRPLAADPPECWLMHLPSFATQWFGDLGVRPHEDLDVLSTPALSAAGDNTVLGGGGYLAAWSDRPEVREAMRRLVGPDFGHTMYGSEEAGEWVFSANADFSLDAYNNPAQRTMAAEVRDAVELDRFRFDGSDLMPVPVSDAFWEAMVMFLQDGPDNLDDVLAHVEAAWDAWEASGDGTSTG